MSDSDSKPSTVQPWDSHSDAAPALPDTYFSLWQDDFFSWTNGRRSPEFRKEHYAKRHTFAQTLSELLFIREELRRRYAAELASPRHFLQGVLQSAADATMARMTDPQNHDPSQKVFDTGLYYERMVDAQTAITERDAEYIIQRCAAYHAAANPPPAADPQPQPDPLTDSDRVHAVVSALYDFTDWLRSNGPNPGAANSHVTAVKYLRALPPEALAHLHRLITSARTPADD